MNICSHLEQDVGEDDEAGVDQVEYQPDLDRLDGGGGGEAARHVQVDGGQHHHARDCKQTSYLFG